MTNVHRLTDKDTETKTATCSICGPVRLSAQGQLRGEQRLRCENKVRRRDRVRKKPHRKHVKSNCENPQCTATIVDPCQLDVHHLDGDHSNNDPSNLQTLCANCHRII